ncbi:MAG: M16 family metallopeptidase [Candidatus Limnocylindria bacterium]
MATAVNPLRPPAGSPRPYRFPHFERQRLANGLTIWLVPLADRELASVHLLFDAGAASEEEQHGGVAALTARVLVTGTRRLDAAAFAEASEQLGIEVSSESSWDSARAAFQATTEHVPAGLELLTEMVREPRMDSGEFERLRAERLADILQAHADPRTLADEAFLRFVFDETTAYRRPAAGTTETVEALVLDDVRTFHERHYAPSNAHLILSGRFDAAALVSAAERLLGDWSVEGSGHRPIAAAASSTTRRVVVVDRPGSVQSELRVGHIGIDRYDADFFPALVLGALLGGVFNSRLNRRLREELGYTYGARAAFDPRRSAGPFATAAAVQTAVTVDAVKEILVQLDSVRAAPAEEAELRDVKDYLIGVFPLRFETTAGVAAAIEPLAVYGLPDDYWVTYRDRIDAVAAGDVLGAAQRLVRPSELAIVMAAEAERVGTALEGADFGPVEIVEAEPAAD